MVSKLSRLGAHGRYPANCERDLHRTLHKFARRLKVNITRHPVRFWSHKESKVEWMDLPMLFRKICCKLSGAEVRQLSGHMLFGTMTDAEIESYWKHVNDFCPWFQKHPARNLTSWKRLGAITSYGDEVNCYRNSECGVVSICAWSAELAIKNDALFRWFPLTVWSEHEECEHTYTDVIKCFTSSIAALQTGRHWPWSDCGYAVCFSGVQGDLKWLCEQMNGIHNYRQNEFCSRCTCRKTDDDPQRTLPNFTPGAHEMRDWSQVDLADRFSPLLGLPAMGVDRVLHDVMHSQYLGTGKSVNGILGELVF